MDNPQSR